MKPRALIIEDRTEVAVMYARSMEAAGFEVFIASNLTAAYQVLAEIPPPDVVFLDLNLNEKENAEYTVQQIEHIKSFNLDMTVIVVSGVLTEALIKIATLQGAAAVKEKLDMRHQVDLWKTVEEALQSATDVAKGRLRPTIHMLHQLAHKLKLLL